MQQPVAVTVGADTVTANATVVVSGATGMPSMQSIIDGAGLSNPNILVASGSVTANTPGMVIENLNIANGSIVVNANNVTIRNCRISGSSSTAIIKPARDVYGTTVEHCEVNAVTANGAIGYLGYDTTVRNCELTGLADGIKVETGGLYEGNYIHMVKPPGSTKHLDGIQGSSDRNFTIRHNVIDANKVNGGNAAIFVQAWNGAINQPIYGIRIVENYVWGGNYTVYLNGGKDNQGDPNPERLITDTHLIGNVFTMASPPLYGNVRIDNCPAMTIFGNVTNTGAVVNPCGST